MCLKLSFSPSCHSSTMVGDRIVSFNNCGSSDAVKVTPQHLISFFRRETITVAVPNGNPYLAATVAERPSQSSTLDVVLRQNQGSVYMMDIESF